jgi:hypothetical protein
MKQASRTKGLPSSVEPQALLKTIRSHLGQTLHKKAQGLLKMEAV